MPLVENWRYRFYPYTPRCFEGRFTAVGDADVSHTSTHHAAHRKNGRCCYLLHGRARRRGVRCFRLPRPRRREPQSGEDGQGHQKGCSRRFSGAYLQSSIRSSTAGLAWAVFPEPASDRKRVFVSSVCLGRERPGPVLARVLLTHATRDRGPTPDPRSHRLSSKRMT